MVYDYIRKLAGIELDVSIDNPNVEKTFHPVDEHNAFLVLINHNRKPTKLSVGLQRKIKDIELVTKSGSIKSKGQNNFNAEISASDGCIIKVKLM